MSSKKNRLPSNFSGLNNSSLVRLLNELGSQSASKGISKGIEASHQTFTERLGDMIDFSGSVKLSEMHGELRVLSKRAARGVTFNQGGDARIVKQDLNDAYARVRRAIEQTINQSFDANGLSSRIKLPTLNEENLGKPDKAFDPYKKFYAAHQKDMAAKIQGLRTFVRDSLSAESIPLAQLVILDQTLDETLAINMRRSFTQTLKFLNLRFDEYLDARVNGAAEQPMKDQLGLPLEAVGNALVSEEANGGFELFYIEMHDLLLAELEVRLQPVLGLIEAFNDEVSNNT